MVVEIFQLSISDENASETGETAENLLEILVFSSQGGARTLEKAPRGTTYFQGNFQKLKTSEGVIFPIEFLEMYA